MADNVAITAGVGTTIHADEYTHSVLGSGKTQLVKLVDGTLNSEVAIAAGGGVEAAALRVTIANDSTGLVSVDDNAGALTVDWAGTAPPIGAGVEATALRVTLATDSTGVVSVDDNAGSLTVDGTVAVTNAGITSIDGKITACNTGAVVLTTGTAGIGKLIANSGVDIGDVDVTSISAGTNLIGKVGIDQVTANANEVVVKSGTVTAVTSITNAVAVTNAGITSIDAKMVSGTDIGDVTINNAAGAAAVNIQDGGNTITVDGTVAITSASLASINTKMVTGTVIGDVNLGATDNAVLNSIVTNTNRAAITGYGQAKLDHADVTTAQVLVAAIASVKFYITSITLSVAAAGSYWIEDDDAAQITCKWTLAANGGLVWSAPIDTPWKSTTVNRGLKVKGSAAGVIGCMITYYTLA